MANSTIAISADQLKGDIPQVMSAVLKAMGGHDMYGQLMVDDVSRIRSSSIPEDKRERLVLSYHRLFLNMMGKKDQYEFDTSEFANLSSDELKVMLRQSALDSMKLDPEFRQRVLEEMSQVDPDGLRKAIGVKVLEAEPAYTEALDERPE